MSRPDIVVVLTDQQRWDTVGLNGNPLDLTPNLDELGRRGVNFPRAFTPQPVCAPARAALLTGRYATQVGVHRNDLVLAPEIPTLADYLGAAGYATAYIGKWHLAGSGVEPVPRELRGGFEHWLAADIVELMSDAYEPRLFDADGRLVEFTGYRTDAYVDAAIEYLREDRDRPLLLFVSLLEPHHQNSRDDYPAPDGYAERFEDAWMPGDLTALDGTAREQLPGYLGMVKRIDEAFGRLLGAIERGGRSEETVVVFTSDHGCHFKTRNGEYKRSAHDASIRVPLVMHGPGIEVEDPEQLVSLVDVAPTILEAAGVELPPGLAGSSLTARGPQREEVYIQISESQIGRAIRTERWTYSVSAPEADPLEPSAARYVEDLLYDLENDPHELDNLVANPAHAELRAELRARMYAAMARAGEPEVEIVPFENAHEVTVP
jgi:arylsulfatase A-like enzyme